MTGLLAAALVFGCVWTALADQAAGIRQLGSRGLQRPRQPVLRRAGAGAALCVAGAWMLWDSGPRTLLVAAMGAAAAAVLQRLVRGAARRRARVRRSSAVIELCDALSAELRAGLPTVVAIERAVADWPEWSPVVTAARLGADVPTSLRGASDEPGAEGLRAVAASWEVAEQSGAALADVLDQIAIGLRSDEDARAEVAAALAPPRATAKMLAALPLFGLGLGYSMDADPLDFLLHSTVGLGCLGAGVALALTGLWWVEGLADSVEG